jgi:hypothetical protein
MHFVNGQKKYVGRIDGFKLSEFADELKDPVDFRLVCSASISDSVVIWPGGKSV